MTGEAEARQRDATTGAQQKAVEIMNKAFIESEQSLNNCERDIQRSIIEARALMAEMAEARRVEVDDLDLDECVTLLSERLEPLINRAANGFRLRTAHLKESESTEPDEWQLPLTAAMLALASLRTHADGAAAQALDLAKHELAAANQLAADPRSAFLDLDRLRALHLSPSDEVQAASTKVLASLGEILTPSSRRAISSRKSHGSAPAAVGSTARRSSPLVSQSPEEDGMGATSRLASDLV